VLAATGDVLFRCSFDTPASPDTAQKRWAACGGSTASGGLQIVSTPWGQGLRSNGVFQPIEVSGSDVPARNEVTIVYREKYSQWPVGSNANIKSLRPFIGPGSGDYMCTMITAYFNTSLASSVWADADLYPSNLVTSVPMERGWCYSRNADGSYKCDGGPNEAGGAHLHWSTDGGTTSGNGAQWRKWRVHIKAVGRRPAPLRVEEHPAPHPHQCDGNVERRRVPLVPVVRMRGGDPV
jgi:hypothetical protein